MNKPMNSDAFPLFCQVLDLKQNLIGITTELFNDQIRLSLPRYYSLETLFPVILKRVDVSPPLSVTLILNKIESQPRNEQYDEIRANIENPDVLKAFLVDDSTIEINGLINSELLSEIKVTSFPEKLKEVGVNAWQQLSAFLTVEII